LSIPMPILRRPLASVPYSPKGDGAQRRINSAQGRAISRRRPRRMRAREVRWYWSRGG